MWICRETVIIDGKQYVPGQAMSKPHGSLNASGKSSSCRPLGVDEGLVTCEECGEQFSATFSPAAPLPYHRRLVHNDPPKPEWVGKYWDGMPSKPTAADWAEFQARKGA